MQVRRKHLVVTVLALVKAVTTTTSPEIFAYGGFARAAMQASLHAQRACWYVMVCNAFPKDIRRLIAQIVFDTRFDCNAWFYDAHFSDLDLLVTRVPQSSFAFAQVAHSVHSVLCEMLENISGCPYRYVRDICRSDGGQVFDYNFHRNGQTSHCTGMFYHYFASFSVPQKGYEAPAESKRWHHGELQVDIVCLVEQDTLGKRIQNRMLWSRA